MPVAVDRPSLGPDVFIDVDRLIESRLLVQANSGAGKSWVLRRLLEQTYGRCQHLVLDVEGEFHTLREKFDYVLAGPRGSDCPATVRCAALLARRLLELGASAIVDICELGVQRPRFVARFLNALVTAPSSLWRPALVVVDEAQLFAAEGVQPLPLDEQEPRTSARDRGECAGAVIDLMSLGRKRGLAGVLATQRLAKLHKDAAAEAINKLIGRTTLDIDRRRAGAELGFASRDLSQLRKLRAGEFFAFGPALTEEVTLVRVGPVVTTHPKAGHRSAAPAPPRAKIREVLSQLADLPAEAETEARTLDQLRSRVVELERALATRPSVPMEQRLIVRHVLTDEQVARLEAAVRTAKETLDNTAGALGSLSGLLTEAVGTVGPLVGTLAVVSAALQLARPAASDDSSQSQAKDPASVLPAEVSLVGPAVEATDSTKAEVRLLEALAWSEGVLGLQAPSVEVVAFLAGYRPGGGSFNNLRGRLRSRGLVVYPTPGFMELTAEGRVLAPWPVPPAHDAQRREMVLGRLSGAERRLLNNLRGRLRSLGLVEYPRPGHVRAAAVLFLGRSA